MTTTRHVAKLRRGSPADAITMHVGPDGTRGFVTVDLGHRTYTSAVYPMFAGFVGDLDGDGFAEVILGVWSRTPRHDEPEPHRTVWVLGWDGRRLIERWRGSALSRPLRDFSVADLDGDGTAELIALERAASATADERCVLTVYRWSGFGFAGLSRRSIACDSRFSARHPTAGEADARGTTKIGRAPGAQQPEPTEGQELVLELEGARYTVTFDGKRTSLRPDGSDADTSPSEGSPSAPD